ncbi:replication initiation protein [Psychrilyobacter atlanticus]|uniref:replication initiation protein n=1 Tax=Psychrilyobacter atlanticus TaxID=271091 RepID=UPI000415FFDB|nr:replication initiation protein [Psychrilyobacter atlanticus]
MSKNSIFLDAESFEKSFSLKIEPKLKSKEKIFLDKLIKKISINSHIAFFSLGELYGIYKSKDILEIKKNILRLSKKKMFFTLINLEKETIQGEFYLLNSIYLKNDGVYVTPPLELIYSLDKKSIFHRIDLSTFIRFKEKHTFNFYPKIIENYDSKKFEYNITQLKEILGVEDDYYERFYDFEKNIIKPIINDINKSSKIHIHYEKIKNGQGKTNKITCLKFSFIDSEKDEILKNTNITIHSIKNKIHDIPKISKLIESSLDEGEPQIILKLIDKIKLNFAPPIDVFLEAALKSHYRLKDETVKIIDISENFTSCFKIEGRLYKELSIFNFSYNYYFLKELQHLRMNGIFNYNIFPWKIKVRFNSKEKSSIKIYMNLKEEV